MVQIVENIEWNDSMVGQHFWAEEASHRWIVLPRVQIVQAGQRIQSLTGVEVGIDRSPNEPGSPLPRGVGEGGRDGGQIAGGGIGLVARQEAPVNRVLASTEMEEAIRDRSID